MKKKNDILFKKQLTCDLNDQCEINTNNRHVCSACRLAKCFSNGMQPELIRCPLTKKDMGKQNQPASVNNFNYLKTKFRDFFSYRYQIFYNRIILF